MHDSPLDRRSFLRTAGALGAALGGLAVADVRSLVAEARRTGQPPLTPRTLKEHVDGLRRDTGRFQSALRDARRDPATYVQRNFSVTERQGEALKDWPRAEMQEFQGALDGVLAEIQRLQDEGLGDQIPQFDLLLIDMSPSPTVGPATQGIGIETTTTTTRETSTDGNGNRRTTDTRTSTIEIKGPCSD